jgi:hypothetical protein
LFSRFEQFTAELNAFEIGPQNACVDRAQGEPETEDPTMKCRTEGLVVSATTLALCLTAASAGAQCSFDKPGTAKKMQLEFVAAYPECTLPNDTNDNASMNTCSPPAAESLYQWGPKGRIQLKLGQTGNKVENPILNPPGTADVGISLKLQDILEADGSTPANWVGAHLKITARVTCDQSVGGDMTAEDYEAEFQFDVADGKGTVKTSANVAINADGIPGIPPCCNIDITRLAIEDPVGNEFGRPGFVVPAL